MVVVKGRVFMPTQLVVVVYYRETVAKCDTVLQVLAAIG
jgi:hypothetical protein